jgi:tRNA uridine 5-carbamoylmethylation protein Kti12
LEDDLKERSDAQKSIEQNKRKLGERDAATLSTQVQQISMASHVVYVALPLQRSRTQRLLSQVSDVENTLQDRSEELQKIDTQGMNYEEKKWLGDEKQAVEKARAQLAQVKASARQTLDQIDKQSEALEKEYDKAFAELINATRAKAPKQ